MAMMKIIINGQLKEISEVHNLQQIITQLNKKCSGVVAEVNGNIVKSTQWPKTTINEGDTIELVTLVGGG